MLFRRDLRRFLGFIIIGAIVLLLAVGCAGERTTTGGLQTSNKTQTSSNSSQVSSVTKPSCNRTLESEEELFKLYLDPDEFKGCGVRLYVRVFNVFEGGGGMFVQGYSKPDEYRGNTFILLSEPRADIKENDIIYVEGTVIGEYTYENVYGGKVSSLQIMGNKVSKSDYATAFARPLFVLEGGSKASLSQQGLTITINKIEFAEKETRVHVTYVNKSKTKVSIYTHSVLAAVGENQYRTTVNYIADYKEPDYELLPGTKTQGVLLFPAIDYQKRKLKLIFEVFPQDWSIHFDPMQFNLTW